MNSFGTIFLSIILEGFPFILLGTLVSSLIQVFVSGETISRILPKNKFLGVLCAASMGIVFPICECAIIPITRRLMKKGLPLSLAITFMLSVPIMNPVSIMSTYYAFIDKPYMVLARIIFGVLVAIIVGYLIEGLYKGNPLKESKVCEANCNCSYHKNIRSDRRCKIERVKKITTSDTKIHRVKRREKSFFSVVKEVFYHLSVEFYEVGALFTVGALLSAILQCFVPRSYLMSIGGGNVSSIILMLLIAFILSVCSETDAFIAKTFISTFTKGSVIGFLILGPMIDIKNAIMLFGGFKKRFSIILIFLIFALCFIMSCIANIILG
ncbi:MAG: permease [Clostridium sp.]